MGALCLPGVRVHARPRLYNLYSGVCVVSKLDVTFAVLSARAA